MGQKYIFFTPQKIDLALPDFLEIQKHSYQWFLKRGIKDLFKEFSPIEDFADRNLELYFLDAFLDEPKFNEREAKERNLTYEAALRVKARLVDKKTGKKNEQEIYFGDIPLMTEFGTFIINGVERVVINQLVRSPGVYFTREIAQGRFFYGAKIIPERGAWLEFETDTNQTIWARINRQRKLVATSLLRALGYGTDEEIVSLFEKVNLPSKEIKLLHQKLGEAVQGRLNLYSEILAHLNRMIEKDPAASEAEGLIEVYRKIRPGEMATPDNARSLIRAMFFNPNRYDLGPVGRYKINQCFTLSAKKFGEGFKTNDRILRPEDLTAVISEIIRLTLTEEDPDDIDHLANRRIRAVGELVQSRMRVGLMRLQRLIKDRMSTLDFAQLSLTQLVNPRPVISVIREFFMSSQLSQFMEQANPLTELEHKRRFTVGGPGGLARERAGFEVRDVHRSYYGRICPIATPEGQNVGLVGQLACYAKLNEFGFIETPYQRVKNARLTKEFLYLDAFEEEQYKIASASTKVDKEGRIIDLSVEARIYGQPGFCQPQEIDFIDVSSHQIFSVATSLIPFLEHDDATRSLMGSNMQRQAVPLIKPEAPLIGTGLEEKVARDSGQAIFAKSSGKAIEVDANHLTLLKSSGQRETYQLKKFIRSNADTCFNQIALREKGERVKKGDVLIDGPATDDGNLALGRNLLVAFMAWEGWNYEDAIIISSRLVKEDVLTSIHIDEHLLEARETKLGPEIITRDIPNVSEESLKNLDEEGVIYLGAEVQSGDILVGKISPKGEMELSAEEKLLRAIFGEKAKDVRDSSLYLEHGEHGKVIGIRRFSRERGDKLSAGVIQAISIQVANLRKVQVGDKLAGRHGNKGVVSIIVPEEDMPYLKDGRPVDIILNPLGIISRMNLGQILEAHLGLAAKILGYSVASPSLAGVSISKIKEELERAGFASSGKVKLYDGKTGESFSNLVAIGYVYIMKLNHLVEDKIHTRSTGPYSLITQQPLGGKAQFGGQRFGEMEVWALEGYGAAYTLQEMLTIKSDDVSGRTKAYESIIRGEAVKDIYSPESFSVLVKELKGLGLNIELFKDRNKIEFTSAKPLFKSFEDRGKPLDQTLLLRGKPQTRKK